MQIFLLFLLFNSKYSVGILQFFAKIYANFLEFDFGARGLPLIIIILPIIEPRCLQFALVVLLLKKQRENL